MKKYALSLLTVGLGLAPVIGLAGIRAAIGRPAVLYNPSPSEPTGLYGLSTLPPRTGRIIAFRVPAAGRAYAGAHLGFVTDSAILKEIAAREGDQVCERAGAVSINGTPRGSVASRDRYGRQLPHWTGCWRLKAGQYFALSNRIPNSFDSRYYGPVSQADLIGVYKPLWTQP